MKAILSINKLSNVDLVQCEILDIYSKKKKKKKTKSHLIFDISIFSFWDTFTGALSKNVPMHK